MAPQVPITAEVTSSKPANVTDTSMKNVSNTDISWLRENVQQLIDN